MQSPVNTVPGFAATTWKTGLEWLVEVDIGWPSNLFDEISVNLSYDEPAHSIGTFLASNDVKPEWVLEPFRVGDEQTPESVINLPSSDSRFRTGFAASP